VRSDHPADRSLSIGQKYLGSADRFSLSQHGRSWIVQEGAVDIFVALPSSEGAGIRHHVARVEAGGIFCGIPESICEWSAVPIANSALVGISGEEIDQKALSFLLQLADWASRSIHGGDAFALAPGDVRQIDAPQRVTGVTEFSWLITEGESPSLVGSQPADWTGITAFPLTERTVYEVQAGHMRCEQSGEQDPRRIRASLPKFLVLCDRLHARSQHSFKRSFGESIEVRLRSDIIAANVGDKLLGSVLQSVDSETQKALSQSKPYTDPLCAAIAYLCGLEGITAPQTLRPCSQSVDVITRVDDILCNTGILWRQARLTGAAWVGDIGHFLAFDRASNPLVMHADGNGRYRAYDPAAGDFRAVTALGPGEFDERVVVLSRHLPDEPVTDRQMLTFGLAGRRPDLLMLLAMGFATSVIALLLPLVISTIVGSIIPDAALVQLKQYGFLLIGVTLSASLFGLTQALTGVRLSGLLDSVVQSAIWDRILRLPAPFFRGFSAGDLTSRAMVINSINSTLTSVTLTAALTGLFAFLNFALMLWYSWQLALAGLAMAVATLLGTVLTVARQQKWQRKAADVQGRLSGITLQIIAGMNKLRVAAAEARAYMAWSGLFAEQNRYMVRSQALVNGLTVMAAVVPSLGVMLLFMSIALWSSSIRIADFIAFNAAFGQFFGGIVGLSGVFASLASVAPQYKRVSPILSAVSELSSAKGDPGTLKGRVDIRRVSFSYDPTGRPILSDVSISAAPGEFIAIVGPSGSGKSTLARLLIGFEAPSQGVIAYDERDLATLNVQAIRRQLGVVVQNSQIPPGTIFQIIAGNRTEMSLDEAWAAAAMVGLDADINAMPMQMDTQLAEGAATISVGQRQRLMIARALIKRPRVLLFDEATSALDNQAQAVVTESVSRLNATRIIIAQRLSTIMGADRIYVIERGQVRQQGTYEELIASQGLFQEFAKRQLL